MTTGTVKQQVHFDAAMLARGVALLLVPPALMFLAAGRLDWWEGWLYTAAMLVSFVVSRVMVARRDPGLLVERGRSMTLAGAKRWDRWLVPPLVLLPLAAGLVVGLDVRCGWSVPVDLWLKAAGAALLLAGYAFSSWALVVNRFFSGVVRIQTERGHTVCSDGPYRYVRHPGYAGFMAGALGLPLLFGSVLALIPIALTVLTLVVRTALEDQMLHAELPGYAAYAQRTRYRLVPGVW